MATQLFVNLPIKDLKKSMDFFSGLGFSFNMQYTNELAACMIINQQAFAMLLTENFFKGFIKNPISDAHSQTEVLNALSYGSREAVNELMTKALAMGAAEARDTDDQRFMYSRSFHDLDGHIWELFWMDENGMPENVGHEGQPTAITVTATVNAPVEKVWQLWTEPSHIEKWNNASDDWHTPHATNDLRPGGKFLSRMEARDGSMGFDFEGVYTEVAVNTQISYEMADGRKVSITFESQGNATKVTETFDPETINPLEMQRGGWQSILNNFKNYTETN
jgi:predicted lactoylglutathione lyase/uncharacterized protein YndB with AHSA1/START domain